MDPLFLLLEEVLDIHADQVDRYGGDLGVRSLELLQSALAVPAAGAAGEYFHADLHEMAAAYLFHIVSNHPFVDGNKRTGTVAALVFLHLNGLSLEAEEDALADLVLGVAEGKMHKSDVAGFLRAHSKPREA